MNDLLGCSGLTIFVTGCSTLCLAVLGFPVLTMRSPVFSSKTGANPIGLLGIRRAADQLNGSDATQFSRLKRLAYGWGRRMHHAS
jgi:hypothetical protein